MTISEPALQIRTDDLSGRRIAEFLQEHLDYMYEISPPGTVHALDLDELRAKEVTFWAVWQGDDLLGCCALKELGPRSGEIKSMRTAPEHRGKGVASHLLAHVQEAARTRGMERLYLETGSTEAFLPAHRLYERHGFEVTGPFGDYRLDPHSVFMTKTL